MKFNPMPALKLLVIAGTVLGAVQAQAQTTYSVTFSQTFSGSDFGDPSPFTVSGSFMATNTNDLDTEITTSEVDLASFALQVSGGLLGTFNFGGVNPPIDSVELVFDLTNTNLGLASGNLAITAIPASGFGALYAAGAQQGFAVGGGEFSGFDNGNLMSVGQNYAFLQATGAPQITYTALPAVPEPQTYLMMLAGIAGLAAFARRKA